MKRPAQSQSWLAQREAVPDLQALRTVLLFNEASVHVSESTEHMSLLELPVSPLALPLHLLPSPLTWDASQAFL